MRHPERIEDVLKFCPMCGKELKPFPNEEHRVCYEHGELSVEEYQESTDGSVTTTLVLHKEYRS